jgi:hypothetical protein
MPAALQYPTARVVLSSAPTLAGRSCRRRRRRPDWTSRTRRPPRAEQSQAAPRVGPTARGSRPPRCPGWTGVGTTSRRGCPLRDRIPQRTWRKLGPCSTRSPCIRTSVPDLRGTPPRRRTAPPLHTHRHHAGTAPAPRRRTSIRLPPAAAGCWCRGRRGPAPVWGTECMESRWKGFRRIRASRRTTPAQLARLPAWWLPLDKGRSSPERTNQRGTLE